MGCDIHAFLEVKFNCSWHNFGEIEIYRDYNLFSKMTDIVGRGNEVAIAPQKGYPVDCTEIVRFLIDDQGTHTHSWLNKEEIKELLEWIKKTIYDSTFNDIESKCKSPIQNQVFLEYIADDYPEFEDYRLVFGFDN